MVVTSAITDGKYVHQKLTKTYKFNVQWTTC